MNMPQFLTTRNGEKMLISVIMHVALLRTLVRLSRYLEPFPRSTNRVFLDRTHQDESNGEFFILVRLLVAGLNESTLQTWCLTHPHRKKIQRLQSGECRGQETPDSHKMILTPLIFTPLILTPLSSE